MGKHFTFKEIIDQVELEKAFRLRYEVYEKSRMQFLLRPNAAKIDLDIFDLHSRHFGIFYNNNIAGYIRVVIDRKSYFNTTVASVGLENNVFEARKFIGNNYVYNGEANFPFLSYAGVPHNVKAFYIEKAQCFSIIEASRLIVLEQFRGHKFSITLIECAIVAGMHVLGSEIGIAVLDCSASQKRVYQLFGFQTLPNTSEYYVLNSDLTIRALSLSLSLSLFLSLSLSLSLSDVPPKLHDKIQKMSDEFEQTLQIKLEL